VVGIHVLTQQGNLPRAAGDQAFGFGEDFDGRARMLGATGIGYHAEAAKLVAALLDRKESRNALGRRSLGQMIELGLDRKIDVEHPALLACRTGDQLRQAVVGLRAEHQVNLGRAAQDLSALGLRDTAGHCDGHARPGRGASLFEWAQPSELGIDLLRGFLADMTGVEDHHVGTFWVRHRDVAERRQHIGHTRGIINVHLAAVGLYVQRFGQGRFTLSFWNHGPDWAVHLPSDT